MRHIGRRWAFLPALIAAAVLLHRPAAGGDTPARTAVLARIGADRWHQSGFRGQGVKVAVLDTGFHGYKAFLGRHLPEKVTAKSFRLDGDMEAKASQHGILCAEIVHAIAPEAELLFATWQPEIPASFVEAVHWARKQGAKVVTCSVIMPCWGDGEGGGPTHEALRRTLGDGGSAGDPLAIACAGNVANRHWSGPFHGEPGGWHRWPNGLIDNQISAWGDELVSVELCRPEGGGYVLEVFDAAGHRVSREATRPGDERRGLVVRFLPQTAGKYVVRVQHAFGPPGMFHVTTLGAWLDQHAAAGSIPFPGDGPEWFTVGAWENGGRAKYSSCGPNSRALKPDLVGPVPFPSGWRTQPFGGTSAAAPQAAGLAALFWSRHPQATAIQVREALCIAAEDVLTPGHDAETGYGLLRLP